MKIFQIIKLTLIVVFVSIPLFAQNKQKSTIKIPIAVIDLKTNNCPEAYGRGMAEMISGKLFNFKKFILLERSQIDVVLREKGFKKKKKVDTDYAAGIGKVLAVEKILVGSMSKFNKYRIEIRVVNVNDNRVELAFSKETASTDDFKRIAAVIAQKIDDYYQGRSEYSGDYDMNFSLGVIKPLNDLQIVSEKGFAFKTDFTLNNYYGVNNLKLMLQTGFYWFLPKESHVDYMYSIPLSIMGGYRFNVSRFVSFVPAVGVGYLFSIVSRDSVNDRTYGESNYKSYIYYNPTVTLRAELGFLVTHRCYLIFTPYYIFLFESARTGQFTGIDLGVRILF